MLCEYSDYHRQGSDYELENSQLRLTQVVRVIEVRHDALWGRQRRQIHDVQNHDYRLRPSRRGSALERTEKRLEVEKMLEKKKRHWHKCVTVKQRERILLAL
jgi:hypothetical protein